ncbi:3046_t:CDS:2 [Funneliformis geosporum]|uniref:6838_t:CDS:1 n=1 Tax=Funneliformis geosporum TaxID=1117311 RepID=A0A9W4SIL5_9GLOM|nr:3046_t:CDS:2 [Funneliformis geosporum]CAI2170894.1 6838_t:CDS:2 [Funneliformis geosporum]
MELDFNCNSHLLTNSQLQNPIQSSNSFSYFATPDKDTTISLQDIIDGTKVMQEISKDSTTFDLDLTHFDMDLNENSFEWLIQESCTETSKQLDTCQSLTEKEPDEECRWGIDDLIEEHMKEMKKFIHNEILCQELLTESSSLEFQDLSLANETENNDCLSTSSITTAIYNQEVICQEAAGLLSTTNMFMPQENNFSYDPLTIEETPNLFSTNLLDSFIDLESHKAIHNINDEIFVYNDVPGCNMKFEYQLDYLN